MSLINFLIKKLIEWVSALRHV